MATIAYALVRVAKTPTLSVESVVNHGWRTPLKEGRTYSLEFSNCARTAMS